MPFSWSAYLQNVERFPIARLVLMSAALTLMSALPWLEGPAYWGAPVAVGVGLAIPCAAFGAVRAHPRVAAIWLRVSGVCLMAGPLVRHLAPESWAVRLVLVISWMGATWVAVWFVGLSDPKSWRRLTARARP